MDTVRTDRSRGHRHAVGVFAIIAVTLAACAGQATAAGGKAISKVPVVITKPGVYVLKKDIVTPITSGAAIVVATNNVVIDLNGCAITYRPASPGTSTLATGIYADVGQRLAIRNGTVSGFRVGILVGAQSSGQGLLIENVVVNDSRVMGINVSGIAPIIRRCSVLYTTNSSDVFGLLVSGGRAARISECTIYNTSAPAGSGLSRCLQVIASGSIIEDNHVYNDPAQPGTYGIQTSGAMFVSGNRIGNMTIGIAASSTAAKLSRNLTSFCTTPFSGTYTLVDGND